MTCNALIVPLLRVLLLLVKSPMDLSAVEYTYPVRSISVFINDSKVPQYISKGLGNYTQIVNSPSFVYVISNGNELLKLKKDTLQISDKYSPSSACAKEEVCEILHFNLVQYDTDYNMLWYCLARITKTDMVYKEDQPSCYITTEDPLGFIQGQWPADKFISRDFQKPSVTLSSSGHVYVGMYTAMKTLQIYKNPVLFARTISSEKIINLPLEYLESPGKFIMSFKYENSIYFLLLETDFLCGFISNQLQTRLLRICENDVGHSSNDFSAIAKINVVCEQGSSHMPYVFGVASAATWLPQSKKLAVSFISKKNEGSSSGLCIYEMKSIEDAFNSETKRRGSEKFVYSKNLFTNTCSNYSTKIEDPIFLSKVYATSKTNPLRKKMLTNKTIFHEDRAMILQISFDESLWSILNRRVLLFLGVEYPQHSALVFLSLEPKICVLEKMVTPERITSIEMIKDEKKHLYIGTSEKLFILPMNRCVSYRSKDECTAFLNPYCAWSSTFNLCVFVKTEYDLKYLTKSENICPQISKDWSALHLKIGVPCALVLANDPLERIGTCNCKSNELDNTIPKNCEVDGNWSPYSEWSDCSVTCDSGFQTRSRSCDNPSPMNGGKLCEGEARERRQCQTNIECKKTKDSGTEMAHVSPWSAWSTCSATCGLSYRQRSRTCLLGSCPNDLSERTSCESSLCENIVTSDWSEWLPFNSTESSRKRLRIRCVEKFIYRPQSVALKLIVQPRYSISCGDQQCFEINSGMVLRGRWELWSSWSSCSATCGVGLKTRSRSCLNKGCLGPPVEVSRCNSQVCSSTWSCWSNWVGCSSLCETVRTQTRHRYCLDDHFSYRCVGAVQEQMECPLVPCTAAYSQWSMWSSCSHNGVITRSRKCKSTRPCLSPLLQSKPCARASTHNKPIFYSSIYMIVSALMGLFVGVVVGSVIGFLWWRFTLAIVEKTHSESQVFNPQHGDEPIYNSQSLNTLPDNTSSINRQMSSPNYDLHYLPGYVPLIRDEMDSYNYAPQPSFSDNSYSATRQPLPELREVT